MICQAGKFIFSNLVVVISKNVSFYVLTEEIMTAEVAEVINLFTVSDSKISVGEQSTPSV